MSLRKPRLANLLLLVCTLVVLAFMSELTLRLLFPAPIRWRYPQETYRFDQETGHWLVPDQHAFTMDRPVETNSRGLRDGDYAPFPPAGGLRLMGLGDSETFGNGLALPETWPKQLQSILNDGWPSHEWEVINAGIPGTNTWQHEIMLDRLLDWYHPTLVILGFYINDVAKRFKPRRQENPQTNTATKRLGYFLKSSSLLLVIRTSIRSLIATIAPTPGGEQSVILGEHDSTQEEAWEQVKQSLARMNARLTERNASLLLVIIPRRDQVSGDQPSTAYNQRIGLISRSLGIPLVDVLAPLRQAYPEYGQRLFVPWDGHDSAIANQILAKAIAGRVAQMTLNASRAGPTGP